MVSSRVAHRYAKALFDLAVERNEVEKVYNDFSIVREITRKNRDIVAMFNSPVIKSHKKITVVKAIFGNQISDTTLQFILVLIRKGREPIIREVVYSYTLIYQELKNIGVANITTAIELDDATRAKIKADLGSMLSKDIILNEKVNQTIIGGYILRVGDKQQDSSIKTKLVKLEREFLSKRIS